MKKTILTLIIMLLLIFSSLVVSADAGEKEGDGFFGWLAGLFGAKKQAPTTEDSAQEPILPLLTEDMLEDDTFEKQYASGIKAPVPATAAKPVPSPVASTKASTEETTSSVGTASADATQSRPCNVLVCMKGKKEINCIDDYRTCTTKYDSCRIISCDPELALESPCYTAQESTCDEEKHLCKYTVKTGSVESYAQIICRGDYDACRIKYDVCQCGIPQEEAKCCCYTAGAYRLVPQSQCNECLSAEKCQASTKEEVECEETKNTCYYKTDPVSIKGNYIDSTLLAVTCQGSYTACKARYDMCECGIKTDACDEKQNTCFKALEPSLCKDSQKLCLRKNEDCACGELPGCSEGYNKCYQNGKEYLCNDDYAECAKRYDKCECGLPGLACSERKHNCYDSVQDTTEYKELKETVCEGSYYDCAQKHDMCLCDTDQSLVQDCPLKQHSCWSNGRTVICNGDLDSCESKYGRCDCGIHV